jgi:hypothetical protein
VVINEGCKSRGNAYSNELILYFYGKAGKTQTSSLELSLSAVNFKYLTSE